MGGMNGYHTIHLNQAMAAQLQQSQHVSPVPVQHMQMQLSNCKTSPQSQPQNQGQAAGAAKKDDDSDAKKDDSDASSKQSEPNSNSSNRSRSGIPLANGVGNLNVATSPKASPPRTQPIQMLAGSGPKNGGALNAGAAPFLLSSKGMISPPISPRTGNVAPGLPPLSAQMNQMALPHPQSFAFPPPPLPHHVGGGHSPFQQPHNLVPMAAPNMNSMGMGNLGQFQHRASPLFTPTQSPQFRPFSH